VGNGKNKFNAMFWVGTNAIFRKSAIDEIGGVIEHSSEDVLTAYKLHENGWKSIYFAEVLATGLAPDTLEAYYKQQERWAGGGFTLFFKQNPFEKLRL
jgi:cellulose synthase (UDP-forming)